MEIATDDISYRRATPDDIETLVNFRVRFLNEFTGHPENADSDKLGREIHDYFSEAMPAGDFIGWLAEYDGRIIGTGGMVIWRIPPRYGGLESGRLGYILNFYTIPEVRRNGICTRLLNELIREASSAGLRYLHLHASGDGMSIYKKAGFRDPAQKEMDMDFTEKLRPLPDMDASIEQVKCH